MNAVGMLSIPFAGRVIEYEQLCITCALMSPHVTCRLCPTSGIERLLYQHPYWRVGSAA